MNVETLILAMMGLGALIVISSLILIVSKQKVAKEINYKNFFVIGIPLMGLGFIWIVIDYLLPVGIAFFCMGSIYLMMSLAYKDKWKSTKTDEKED